ncbi:MAG: hypothetical protein IMZ44_01120 [Planctomycetes bacterium]|nr:hypothetical protein [Planctomycetota bacterium]
MTTCPEAGRSDKGQGPAAALAPWPTASWILLPLAWCLWLLLFLLPTMLVAPHLELPRPWLTADTAPAAVVAAAAFFLTAIWPFWPALAGPWPGHITARWIGLTVLEGVMLIALAAPFALVAWSVGGRALEFGPAIAAAAGLLVFGVLLRATTACAGPAAARWFIFAAMLACAGPLLGAYAASETMGLALERVLEISPVVGAVRLATGGWNDPAWQETAGWMLGWAVLLVFLALGFRFGRASRAPGGGAGAASAHDVQGPEARLRSSHGRKPVERMSRE